MRLGRCRRKRPRASRRGRRAGRPGCSDARGFVVTGQRCCSSVNRPRRKGNRSAAWDDTGNKASRGKGYHLHKCAMCAPVDCVHIPPAQRICQRGHKYRRRAAHSLTRETRTRPTNPREEARSDPQLPKWGYLWRTSQVRPEPPRERLASRRRTPSEALLVLAQSAREQTRPARQDQRVARS